MKTEEQAQIMLDASETFYMTCLLMSKHMANEASAYVIIPLSVQGAFTLELYLKALIYIESGRSVKGHKLGGLYQKVSIDTKRYCQDIYRRAVDENEDVKAMDKAMVDHGDPAHPQELSEVFTEIGDAFILNRYFYEGHFSSVYHVRQVRYALYKGIKKVSPWKLRRKSKVEE